MEKKVCLNKSYNAEINTFLKPTTNTSTTSESGAASLPPIGWAFMYVETSSNNHRGDHGLQYVIYQKIFSSAMNQLNGIYLI